MPSRSKPNQPQPSNSNLAQYQGLVQAAASEDQQIQQTQSELSKLDQQKETAAGKKRRDRNRRLRN